MFISSGFSASVAHPYSIFDVTIDMLFTSRVASVVLKWDWGGTDLSICWGIIVLIDAWNSDILPRAPIC